LSVQKKKNNDSSRAVFLDRDGTINVNTNYVNHPSDVRLLPHAAEGLRILQNSGFQLIIITNQSGIARGYFTEKDLGRINARLLSLLSDEGVNVTDLLYSPYHVRGTIPKYTKDSPLRKPRPGMIINAATINNIDIPSSYLIGDSDSDIGAGTNAGCLANILIRNSRNNGTSEPRADFTASDILEAAVWITLKEQKRKIIGPKAAGQIAARVKKQGKRIIFTNGVFDLLHPGHVEFLKLCRALGDVLFLGLNSDSSVKLFKGPGRPINNEDARSEMLSAFSFVDHIILFPDRTPKKLIKLIKPDIQVKDAAYKMEELLEYKTVVKYGGKVVQLPRIGDHSTTNIIKRIRKT
jgi:rfaE bifunctional protein nucleotidyltransferase chain/domain